MDNIITYLLGELQGVAVDLSPWLFPAYPYSWVILFLEFFLYLVLVLFLFYRMFAVLVSSLETKLLTWQCFTSYIISSIIFLSATVGLIIGFKLFFHFNTNCFYFLEYILENPYNPNVFQFLWLLQNEFYFSSKTIMLWSVKIGGIYILFYFWARLCLFLMFPEIFVFLKKVKWK